MWTTTYLRMEAKAVRVDTQLWGGRHGSAWQALQAQHFLPSAWAQRNTISARGGLQRPQGAIGIRFGEVAPLWDATPASYSWSVTAGDTTPPDTTITSSPALVSKQSTALFKFISTEPGSTFACKLDSYSVQSENLFLTSSCCQKVDNFLNGIIRSAIGGLQFAV